MTKKSNVIHGACLSQLSDNPNEFEFLVAYSDGREIGYSMCKEVAERIADDISAQVDLVRDAPMPPSIRSNVAGGHGFIGTREQLANALYECGDRNGATVSAVCKTAADIIRCQQTNEALTPSKPNQETRRTFTVPEGHYAVRDEDGRATGEVRPLSVPVPQSSAQNPPTFNEVRDALNIIGRANGMDLDEWTLGAFPCDELTDAIRAVSRVRK